MSHLISSLNKKYIRNRMIECRDKIEEKLRIEKNKKITKKFTDLLTRKQIRKVLLYASFGSEVDTWEIFKFCHKNNIKTAFPKVVGKSLEIYWVEKAEQLIAGYKSILEPKCAVKAIPDEIEVVAVPAVSFDKRCFRIGYGGGFYDKLLAEMRGLAVGLAYEEQIIEEIPNESFDQKVDLIITDERVISCV